MRFGRKVISWFLSFTLTLTMMCGLFVVEAGAADSVSFTELSYWSVGSTTATVASRITYTNTAPTEVGVQLSKNSGSYYKAIIFTPKQSGGWVSNKSAKFTFELKSLSEGSNYTFKYYAVIGSTYYYSDTRSFKTTGTAPDSITFSNMRAEEITQTGVSVYATCGYTGTRPYKMGVTLGKAGEAATMDYVSPEITHNKNPFDFWSTGITGLTPGTTYFYQFYVIVNGSRIVSDFNYFTTLKPVLGTPTLYYTAGTYPDSTYLNWSYADYADYYNVKIWKGKYWDGDPCNTLWETTQRYWYVDLAPGYYEAYVDAVNKWDVAMSNVVSFTVLPGDISNATISGLYDAIYTGEEITPEITVNYGTTTLVRGTDYTVSYSNNIEPGTASVTINGIGNYTGSKTETFEIVGKSLPKTFTVSEIPDQIYTGEAITPAVTVKDGTKTLVVGIDYTIKYSDNIEPGRASVTVTGIGNYTGTTTVYFTITKAKSILNASIELSPVSFIYDGTAKEPAVTVTDGTTILREGTDYTVSYSNNIKPGTGYVTIIGVGDYTGTTTVSFTITEKTVISISAASVTLTAVSFFYDGTAKRPGVTVTLNGKTLYENTDYTVEYKNNIEIGTATVIITGKGDYTGTVTKNFSIVQKPAEKTDFEWGKDNWNFLNSSRSGYFSAGTYRSQINSTYLETLKNNLSNTDYQVIFKGYRGGTAWLDEKFGGSCYGMSSTAFLALRGYMPYSSYRSGADCLNDLYYPTEVDLYTPSAKSNVSSLITYYQMLQVSDPIQQQYRTVPNRSNEQNIKQILSLLDKEGTVLLGFEKANWGGHAILAIGYEYGSFTKNGVTYQGRIKICDPNSSIKDNDNYYIYFNTNSYNWAIPAYSEILSTQGARFNYIGASVSDINYGGYLSGTSNYSTNDFVARINAAVISDNRTVTKVSATSNGYMNMNMAAGDVVEDYSYINAGDSKGVAGYTIFDPDASYKVSQSTPSELTLSMDYEDCMLSASSKAGNSVIFDRSGAVIVNGESADYSISMTFDKDLANDWFTVQVSGSNEDEVALKKTENGWIMNGNDLGKVTVSVNNKNDEISAIFSTDLNSVYIYEIDKNTIGIKGDPDGDGVYDTVIKTTTPEPSKTFTISPIADQVYTGSEITPSVVVKDGTKTLKKDTDYTVGYSDNIEVGTATVTVTGIGEYVNVTKSVTFRIVSKPEVTANVIATVNGKDSEFNDLFTATKSTANATGNIVITVYKDLNETKSITMPKNAASLTINAPYAVTLTLKNSSLTSKCDLVLENIKLVTNKGKAVGITAKKNLEISDSSVGALNVTGTLTSTGSIIDGKLTSKGAAVLTDTTVNGKVTASSDLTLTDCPAVGAIAAKGILTITGDGTFTGAISVTGKTGETLLKNVAASGNISASNDLVLVNCTAKGNIISKAKLSVEGIVTANGNVSAVELASLDDNSVLSYKALSVTKNGFTGDNAVTLRVIDKNGKEVRMTAGDKKAVAAKTFKGAFDAELVLISEDNCADAKLRLEKNKLMVVA